METTTFEMMGWPLVKLEGESAPRVSHLILGERIGLARARKARELIERNRAEFERYGELLCRPTAGRQRTGFGERDYEVDSYDLNEGQAMLFATLARTPQAADVREGLIRLYLLVRELGVSGAAANVELARLSKEVAELKGYLLERNTKPSTASTLELDAIMTSVDGIALMRRALGQPKATKLGVLQDMIKPVEWGRPGERWEFLPGPNVGRAKTWLKTELLRLKRIAKSDSVKAAAVQTAVSTVLQQKLDFAKN